MSEIFAVGGSESLTFLASFDEKEQLNTEIEELDRSEPVSNPEESERRMLAEESLRMATTPNFRMVSRAEKIKAELARTTQTDTRFYLYKELFTLQLQAYRDGGGSVNKFAAVARIACTDENKRKECIGSFERGEKELFDSYDQILNLANELFLNTVSRNKSFHFTGQFDVQAIQHAEPCKLYYLQILELEDSLNCPILGTKWIQEQVFALTNILLTLEVEIKAMFIRGVIKDTKSITLDYKEQKFYWKEAVGLCLELLENLEVRWKDFQYNKEKVLNLIFLYRFTLAFPYPEGERNPIDQFLPFILKYGSLEIARNRFDQIYENIPSWDRNFKWVELHIKAADQLVSSDPKKAKIYFEKAQKLINDTLWCFSFSFNRAQWNEKRDEALRLIEVRKSLFD